MKESDIPGTLPETSLCCRPHSSMSHNSDTLLWRSNLLGFSSVSQRGGSKTNPYRQPDYQEARGSSALHAATRGQEGS